MLHKLTMFITMADPDPAFRAGKGKEKLFF